jgi:PD-(D/E)XK nuclease superfamily protein
MMGRCSRPRRWGQSPSARSLRPRSTSESRCSSRSTRAKPYTAVEIDAFAAYCAELDRCYFIRLSSFPGHRAVHLRVAPTQDNQRKGINWAGEYEFGATLTHLGAVAQLGERRDGIAEARGSNPLGSTR